MFMSINNEREPIVWACVGKYTLVGIFPPIAGYIVHGTKLRAEELLYSLHNIIIVPKPLETVP